MLKPRDLAMTILLTAVALLIPLVFTGLRVSIPPFTATLASHVPSMLAMFISPPVAILVGLGSCIGFLIATGPVVAARAFAHVIFGWVGAVAYKRGVRPWLTLLLVLPIHAIIEAIVVIPFGYTLQKAGVVIGIGTLLHHMVDAAITMVLVGVLSASNLNILTKQGNKRSAA